MFFKRVFLTLNIKTIFNFLVSILFLSKRRDVKMIYDPEWEGTEENLKKKGQKRVSLHVWTGNPPLWTETFADTTFYFYPTS